MRSTEFGHSSSFCRVALFSLAVLGCPTPREYVPVPDGGRDAPGDTGAADVSHFDQPFGARGGLGGVAGPGAGQGGGGSGGAAGNIGSWDSGIGGSPIAGAGGAVGSATGPASDGGVGDLSGSGTGGKVAENGTGGGGNGGLGGLGITGTGGIPGGGSGGRGTGGAGIVGGGSGGTGGTGTGGAGTGGAAGGTGGNMMCSSTQHVCLGACVDNNSIAHCGTRCAACSIPIGGMSTCDGSTCDFTCGSMKKCGSKCVAGCCVDADCPMQAGKTGKCDSATNSCSYVCAPGFKPCGTGMCIPAANCCSESDCAGACRTCSTAGSCVAVTNMSDPDSCSVGLCDGSGVCCPSNMAVCGGACTDTRTSNAHCGQCGAPCLAVQTCHAGACLLRDGQPCALAADCASGVCNTFYRDEDGDGHGATTGAIRLCTVTTPPAGYVTVGDDCCDNGGNLITAALIHPGADFQSASAGGICGINWDYNCSGLEEPMPNQLGPSNCGQLSVTCDVDPAGGPCIATCTSTNASTNPACAGACGVYDQPPCGQSISVAIVFCAGYNAGGTPVCQPSGSGNGPLAKQKCR